MLRPLRVPIGVDDFDTDVVDPLEDTVRIPRVLPAVPAPRSPERAGARLAAAALGFMLAAIAIGAPLLAELVTR